jgi:hypothetical protein
MMSLFHISRLSGVFIDTSNSNDPSRNPKSRTNMTRIRRRDSSAGNTGGLYKAMFPSDR